MVLHLIPTICTVLLGVFSLVKLTAGTWFERFLRWALLGAFVDFVHKYHDLVVPFLIVGIAIKWIKDKRWLVAIGLLVFIFLKWVI